MDNRQSAQAARIAQLHLYDEETGFETEESLEANVLAAVTAEIQIGEDLEKALQTPGGKLIVQMLQSSIEAQKAKMIYEQDERNLRQQQSTALAYSDLLDVIGHKISRAKQLREQNMNPEKG